MAGEIGKPKVFRSMAELREHFFPKQFRKEQEKKEFKAILDKSKHDKPNHKRQITDDDLTNEMGL